MTRNIYVENGFKDRRDYLESLVDDYGVSLEVVLAFSEALGETEDFNGLVCELEDLSYFGGRA